MCGICGFNGSDRELIKKMTDVITHRGPDKEGFYVDEHVSLGNRRLSIIDLSERATQPIFNEDKSIAIVYNGEIYNFPELRKELELKGHRFYTNTDTEVVVHSYEEYGVDCLRKFNGMFAFALWDSRKRELFIARDRIGIKPLYYYYDGSKFSFASEIKAILEDSSIPREVNYLSLYYYLGYEFVPSPLTMFKRIFKLEPGNYLLYRDGRIHIKRYWELEFNPEWKKKSDYIERMRELVDLSVRRRLISDVPLGVFLSGGLDSSTVVAFMRKHITGNLKAFSIGYEDKSFSELDYATYIAREFGLEHHILMINEMNPDLIEKSLWHLDEPMTDLSTIPFYLITRKARENVIVALSGEGGDEVFVGYDRFKASKAYNYYRMIPGFLRKGFIEKVVDDLADRPQKKGVVNVLKRFVQGARLPEEALHMRWQYFSNPEQDDKLYNSGFKSKVRFDPFFPIRRSVERCNSTDRLEREIFVDTRFTMPDSVLMKVDKMSMANSLEVRVPFLDHELVEFNATIPSKYKLKGLNRTKAIFRESIKGILPDKIVYRGKQGYSFPSKNWLREQLRDFMIDVINTSPIVNETLNIRYVNRLIEEHLERKQNHNHILWALVNLAVWYNRFF